ncbi:hypothetical protein Plhal304r1_c008g0031261 [Plasmopara halstedii]
MSFVTFIFLRVVCNELTPDLKQRYDFERSRRLKPIDPVAHRKKVTHASNFHATIVAENVLPHQAHKIQSAEGRTPPLCLTSKGELTVRSRQCVMQRCNRYLVEWKGYFHFEKLMRSTSVKLTRRYTTYDIWWTFCPYLMRRDASLRDLHKWMKPDSISSLDLISSCTWRLMDMNRAIDYKKFRWWAAASAIFVL